MEVGTSSLGFMAHVWKSLRDWWLTRRLPPDLGPGDICFVRSKGGFQVAKVLRIDSNSVHIRLYRNWFAEPAQTVDTATLCLDKLGDAGSLGIAHLPLSRAAFASWEPNRIQNEPVTDEELEAYRVWEGLRGGIWS